MFNNTCKSFKETFKKGVDFSKSLVVNTTLSLKTDICQELDIIKDYRDFRKSKLSTEDTTKSE